MKIAVSAMSNDLSAQIDPRFGRCHFLLIVDTGSLDFEAIVNPNIMASGGAGIQTAQLVAEKGAEAVITGHCGPNAFKTLQAADIKVYTASTGNVKEQISLFNHGNLQTLQGPDVGSHSGMRKGI